MPQPKVSLMEDRDYIDERYYFWLRYCKPLPIRVAAVNLTLENDDNTEGTMFFLKVYDK